MKKILFSVALLATTLLQQSFAQDTTKISPLLILYFGLKDALVGGNANTAAASASAFVTALNSIDIEIVKEDSRNTLLNDATAISQTGNLQLQREKFATLSINMFELAKEVKLSTEPLYQQYCPMKKASWLSSSKAIKNPYYGNAMLTCGSIKETL